MSQRKGVPGYLYKLQTALTLLVLLTEEAPVLE
jgi:hypothetical protein